jgi:hypothetical protein
MPRHCVGVLQKGIAMKSLIRLGGTVIASLVVSHALGQADGNPAGNLIQNWNFNDGTARVWQTRVLDHTNTFPDIDGKLERMAYTRAAWIGPWHGRAAALRLIPGYFMRWEDCPTKNGIATGWTQSLSIVGSQPVDTFPSMWAQEINCGSPPQCQAKYQQVEPLYVNARQEGLKLDPQDEHKQFLTLSFDVVADLRTDLAMHCGNPDRLDGYFAGDGNTAPDAVLFAHVTEAIEGLSPVTHQFAVDGTKVSNDWHRVAFNVERQDLSIPGNRTYSVEFWLPVHTPAAGLLDQTVQNIVAEVGVDKVALRAVCSKDPFTGCQGNRRGLSACNNWPTSVFWNCNVLLRGDYQLQPINATSDLAQLQLVCENEFGSCPGDLNGDGTVNGADLGCVLGDWGPAACTQSDLNRDGTVNGADLGLLLGYWGPCPTS